MTRDIKFRVWTGKEMVYYDKGILCGHHGLAFKNWDEHYVEISDNGFETMYPLENLMQYTGLVDKNGKEIYEGDILNPVHNIQKYFHVVVIMKNGCWGWESVENGFIIAASTMRIKGWDEHPVPMAERCEVIGNVYETPELLEGR